MQQTQQRIITAVIALTVFLSALVFLPTNLFKLFVAAIAIGLSYEWYGVIDKNVRAICVFATLIIILVLYFAPSVISALLIIAAVVLMMLFLGLNSSIQLPKLVHVIAGAVLIAATWGALTLVHSKGSIAMLHLLSFVWLADSSAYFCGRAIGKTKLAPNISPGKTREGVIGAVLITIIITYLIAKFFEITPWNTFAFAFFGGFVLVLISVLGDLYQSQQKRLAGVKDSGTILPGHGGLWDRLDSLIPVSVFYVLISQWV